MKLNKETLKRIIKEELQTTLRESIASGGTDYYNKLLTLMSTKAGVYQAETLYEFARDQLDDEEKTFLDNCFRLLEIAREAIKLDDAKAEISKQIREYLKDNQFQSWQIKRRQNDVFLQELENKKTQIYKEIRELDNLFDEQLLIAGDLAAPMVTDNPRVHAFSASRQAAIEEAGGLFGFIDI
jgi:hypothetical protein